MLTGVLSLEVACVLDELLSEVHGRELLTHTWARSLKFIEHGVSGSASRELY